MFLLLLLCVGPLLNQSHGADASDIEQFLSTLPADLPYSDSPRAVTMGELNQFYSRRGFRPIWADRDRLEALRGALSQVWIDGLTPEHYPVPDATRIDDAHMEVKATASWLQAVIDLHFGRLKREAIEPIWHYLPTDIDPQRQSLLASMPREIDEPGRALASASPHTLRYQELREAYLDLLDQQDQWPWPTISIGPILRAGDRNYRVHVLRERLAAEGYHFQPLFGPDFYDTELTRAVRDFQYRHSLHDDGEVGPATLAALNIARAERIDQLRANLERWRWLEPEMEDTLLVVDIAGAAIRYLRDGKLLWQSRTLVGRDSRPTPSLKSLLSHITINPDWTVPPTILEEDKLPKIRQDPDYIARHRLQVITYDGQVLNPSTVNWSNPGGITLRQAPGPYNPLGRVAIRFPNPFSVYLHDTPNKTLFGREQRADSSGCVRIEGAVDLANMILEHAGVQSQEKIDQIFSSGKTSNVSLYADIPLLIDYWTVDTDVAGRLIWRADIYQRDAALARALAQ